MAKLSPLAFKRFYDKIQFFPEYWKSLQPLSDIDPEYEKDWIERVQLLDKLSAQNQVAIFLWNAFHNRFIYMSDKLQVLGGYNPDAFITPGGVNLSFSLIHPDHLNAAMQLYEKGMNFGPENAFSPIDKIVLNLNFLYKNAFGQYFQVLQQCIVVEADENLQPRLVLSFAHNVSHIKKDRSVGLVISSPQGTDLYQYDLNQHKISERKRFTSQEMNVLTLLSQSKSTNQIAARLNISPHTVDTHRRNLINKTDCLDTTGVVTFAKLINVI